MGYCAALVLYGILVMAWVNYTKTPAWDRAAKAQRAIIYVVMLLTTLITTFYIRDLYFYTTITPVDLTPLLIGTEVGQLEPLFVGLIAFIVQTTLAWRSSKVRAVLSIDASGLRGPFELTGSSSRSPAAGDQTSRSSMALPGRRRISHHPVATGQRWSHHVHYPLPQLCRPRRTSCARLSNNAPRVDVVGRGH